MTPEEIKKLKLEPGDKLVLKFTGHLREDIVQRIQQHMAEFAPGVKTLILTAGTELLVLSDDYSTHHDAWVDACTIARDSAEEPDDKAYWQHELDVLAKLRAATS